MSERYSLTSPRPDKTMNNFLAIYHLSETQKRLQEVLIANEAQQTDDAHKAKRMSMVIASLIQAISQTDESAYASETYVWFLIDSAQSLMGKLS